LKFDAAVSIFGDTYGSRRTVNTADEISAACLTDCAGEGSFATTEINHLCCGNTSQRVEGGMCADITLQPRINIQGRAVLVRGFKFAQKPHSFENIRMIWLSHR